MATIGAKRKAPTCRTGPEKRQRIETFPTFLSKSHIDYCYPSDSANSLYQSMKMRRMTMTTSVYMKTFQKMSRPSILQLLPFPQVQDERSSPLS